MTCSEDTEPDNNTTNIQLGSRPTQDYKTVLITTTIIIIIISSSSSSSSSSFCFVCLIFSFCVFVLFFHCICVFVSYLCLSAGFIIGTCAVTSAH
jgi:hypothetical protein